MTNNIIERSLITDSIEIRESVEGRRVCGVAAPFGTDYDVGDYVERFSEGAFAVSIRDRGDQIPLLEAHRHDAMPLGRAIHLEERSDGLYAEFLISRTGRGDEALQLARDGVMHSFSVGFVPVRDKRRTTSDGRPLIERQEVKLHHVGLISEVPAYADARVLAVRDDTTNDDTSRLAIWRARILTL